ncbi:MAG: methylmalonyl-CoA mutase family protein, partial [Candidatus Marinimicrobia bacterium]|nr:methylmalonyl-CoA mutase family protein [Candidatus Neomarinimicrobiota bacterium]
ETGVANVADPLGGSWYIESLTDRMEKEAEAYFKQIEDFGGVIPAIEEGFFQREIAHAASDYQKKVDERSRVVVGVNRFEKENEEIEIPILEIGNMAEEEQVKALHDLRTERSQDEVDAALAEIRETAAGTGNLLPPILKAAKAYATLGEIVDAMKQEFGEWQESAVF